MTAVMCDLLVADVIGLDARLVADQRANPVGGHDQPGAERARLTRRRRNERHGSSSASSLPVTLAGAITSTAGARDRPCHSAAPIARFGTT